MAVENYRKERRSQIKVEFIEIFHGRRVQYPGSLENNFLDGCLFRKATWELFFTWPDVLIRALQQHFPVWGSSPLKCGMEARMSWCLLQHSSQEFEGEQGNGAQVSHTDRCECDGQRCTTLGKRGKGNLICVPSFTISMSNYECSCSQGWWQLLEMGLGIFTA